MIINYSIQNFGAIKDKQILSFEADKSTHLEDYYIIKSTGNLKLLKLAMIYGANASGKTTVLKALDFLRNIALEPLRKKTDVLDFQPFLFDNNTPDENSIITIDFIQNEVRYSYEVEFNVNAIYKEILYFYKPNRAIVYKRITDLDKQLTDISFGSKIRKDKAFEKSLESNTLWNNTVLGGFLKTNIELNELKEVTDWFQDYLRPLIYSRTDLDRYITSQIDQSLINKSIVVSILKKADFNISDILINEEEMDIPGSFLKLFEQQTKGPGERQLEKINKDKLTRLNLEFEHTVINKKYKLSFVLESEGTKRYYGYAGLLSLLIQNSIAFPIDELEASLHPDLYLHFLLSFLINSKKSQIIATTHNREVLNNKDVFRNDTIWFTDKSENCSTELYSLADFDSTVVRDTSNIFNAYSSGKLGGTPILGDNFIDLDDEKK